MRSLSEAESKTAVLSWRQAFRAPAGKAQRALSAPAWSPSSSADSQLQTPAVKRERSASARLPFRASDAPKAESCLRPRENQGTVLVSSRPIAAYELQQSSHLQV